MRTAAARTIARRGDSRSRPRRGAGFTLIEMVIVAALLTILAAVTLPVVKFAEKRQKELQAIKAQVDAFQAKKESIQRQVNLIETLKANQRGPVQMLDRISKALPDFVWLVDLDQVGAIVKFKGESSSLSAVADFMSNLGNSGENCGKPKAEDRTQCWFSEMSMLWTTLSPSIR